MSVGCAGPSGDDCVEPIQQAGSQASQAESVLGRRGTSVSKEHVCRTEQLSVCLSVPHSGFRQGRNDSGSLCPHCFGSKLLHLQRNNSFLLSFCFQLIVLLLKW